MARIALFQNKNKGSVNENLNAGISAIKEAAENGADLILFPEVQLTEFFPQYPGQDVSGYACELDGEIIQAFQAACRGNHIMAVPNVYLREGGHDYDASILIGRDGEIIEIQTRGFNKLRRKLDTFLKYYPVTIVYPIIHTKWLYWINEETGEITQKRKSPKKGNPYLAFKELYTIRDFLQNPNFHVRLVLMDMEEYRLLNGWSRDKKRGSKRYDRLPLRLEDEVILDTPKDYLQFLPLELEEPFTSEDLAKLVKIPRKLAGTVLLILWQLGLVERSGKCGRSYLYKIN